MKIFLKCSSDDANDGVISVKTKNKSTKVNVYVIVMQLKGI